MRHKNWLFPGVLILAGVLRIIALESRGIWYDDAFSIFLSRQPLNLIVSGTAADTMPPLYYFLLHAWMALGQDVAYLRLLNVLLSLGIVGLAYALMRRLFGEKEAILTALFVAVSPMQIYHAQELRMYALMTLAILGYVWFFVSIYRDEGREERAWGNWAGLVICGALAMYSQNLSAFSLIVPDVYLLLRRKWRLLGRLAAAQLGIGLIFLPWLVTLPGQIAKIQNAFWTPRPGIVEIIQAVLTFHTNLPLPNGLMYAAVLVSLWVVFVTAWEYWKNRWWDTSTQILAALVVLPPALMFAVSYLMRPVFVPRAFLISGIAYLGLFARVAAHARVKAAGYFSAGMVVVLALASLPSQYTFQEFPRSDYRGAMAFLRENLQPGDAVVHDNKLSYFPSHYYAPDLPQVFLPDEPGSFNDTLAVGSEAAMGLYPAQDLAAAVGGAARVYFVVFTKAIDEYKESGEPDHPSLIWLEGRFSLSRHVAFGDLEVYEFSKDQAAAPWHSRVSWTTAVTRVIASPGCLSQGVAISRSAPGLLRRAKNALLAMTPIAMAAAP